MSNKSFTDQEDAWLCQLISTNPALYDSKLAEYKNRTIRDKTWEEIGKTLYRSAEECKKRWKTIRDTYMRHKKRVATGAARNVKVPKWALQDAVSFLETIDYKRKSRIASDEDNTADGQPPTDCTVLGNYLQQGLHRISNNQILAAHGHFPIDAHNMSTTSPQLRCKIDNKNNTDLLVNLSTHRGEEDQSYYKQSHEPPEHIIDSFFRTVASTVKSFNPRLQIEAKNQIFKIVSTLEMKNMLYDEGSSMIHEN
nr:PREDICTED: transcription factor Adf-1-like isoform X2 [Bemisia tabaci]